MSETLQELPIVKISYLAGIDAFAGIGRAVRFYGTVLEEEHVDEL